MNKLVVVVLIFGAVVLATLAINPGVFRQTTVVPQTTWSLQIANSAFTDLIERGSAPQAGTASLIGEPLPDSNKRITKKTFGTKVSPDSSPVSPEKFSGYHTGVDFEIFEQERDAEVPVHAVCEWSLIYKRNATGYGWVAVQSCLLDGKKATVVYGHLKLESIASPVGTKIERGKQIGILGKGYTNETWNERKHLHLSIHGGNKLNIMGYVKNRNSLVEWLDPVELLGYKGQ